MQEVLLVLCETKSLGSEHVIVIVIVSDARGFHHVRMEVQRYSCPQLDHMNEGYEQVFRASKAFSASSLQCANPAWHVSSLHVVPTSQPK